MILSVAQTDFLYIFVANSFCEIANDVSVAPPTPVDEEVEEISTTAESFVPGLVNLTILKRQAPMQIVPAKRLDALVIFLIDCVNRLCSCSFMTCTKLTVATLIIPWIASLSLLVGVKKTKTYPVGETLRLRLLTQVD